MIGLSSDEQRQSFVNQLQMALFAWIKRNPAGARPLRGLLVMDEAQTIAPAKGFTACTRSTLALSSQARKYGLGLVFATQAQKGIHNQIPGNAITQFYGLLSAPAQISSAQEMARAKGGFDARHQQVALRHTWRSSGRRFAASRRHGACPITRPVRRLPRKCWVSLGVRPTITASGLAVRRVVSQWYHAGMGMTLRTSEKQTEALRRQALAEGRSMQAIALSAIDEYIERRAHQTEVNAVLDKVIERERGVLRRLADT